MAYLITSQFVVFAIRNSVFLYHTSQVAIRTFLKPLLVTLYQKLVIKVGELVYMTYQDYCGNNGIPRNL